MVYRIAEMYLYDTCTLSCGYCTLAENGSVSDVTQLNKYKDLSFIDRVVAFFTTRTIEDEKWNVILTGGEPLILPNFEHFCDRLFEAGNKVSLYTNLSISVNQKVYKYLLSKNNFNYDYIMASLHPQSEVKEDDFFEKVRRLKEAGHNVIIRFVGHPARLNNLSRLEERCKVIGVCFYPTSLFSNRYPQCYSEKELKQLLTCFSSISQLIQLNGGLDVSNRECLAGSQLICIDMRNGDIRPCITVAKPVLGNIYENQLKLFNKPIRCPSLNQVCSCDTHFQQNIVLGAEDSPNFEKQKKGFVEMHSPAHQMQLAIEKNLVFAHAVLSQGNVSDDKMLFYDRRTLRARYKKTLRKRYLMGLKANILKLLKLVFPNKDN